MRLPGYLAAIAFCLCVAGTAFAQQGGPSLSATQTGIGKVLTRIQKYDQALGVITDFARSPAQDIECGGTCFFANSSKSIAWSCGTGKSCNLFCTVSPPVGGCN